MRKSLMFLGFLGVPLAFLGVNVARANVQPHHAKDTALPLIVTTWSAPCFQLSTSTVRGCSTAESTQCDESIGYGNHPDETGETSLDALIMDGPDHSMGAVGDLRRVRNAIGVANAVRLYTNHSFLVGESASAFALEMGFVEQNLSTAESINVFDQWLAQNCQPNFRKNVTPDPKTSCGPYKPSNISRTSTSNRRDISKNHDTIGMVVIDQNAQVTVATSTNGANHKVAGRVGDSPLPGAGAYVDNDVGGAVGTGDGDVMLRFLPAYQAVESMRQGLSPKAAANEAMQRIIKYYPHFSGAIVAADVKGRHGAACHGMDTFTYNYFDSTMPTVQTRTATCV